MKVYLGADHRGYFLKEKISRWLFESGYKYLDVGAESLDLKDDYTKFATEVASLVAKNSNSRGVILCGSGVGVDTVANKFDGVRASLGLSAAQIKAGRKEDDMNILILAAEFTEAGEAKEMLNAFLETKFDRKARHQRRLEEIKKIEANN
jgi:RpiB/LacA/LacB family sugar-phosphate isomerase